MLEKEEVTFMYDNYFIEIFEYSESAYEGNIFNSKENEPLDGEITEIIVALEFFMDTVIDLRDRAL